MIFNILIVPIIETLLIVLLIKIINKLISNRLIITIITTIIFSLGHYQNIIYIFQMIIPAFIFVYSYEIRTYDYIKPIYSSILIHMLFNAYPFILILLSLILFSASIITYHYLVIK
ncbi:CPBP family glutamic-type intramembrane protease [Clostridium sardiniense]|uniref:CPBP family glutamic-type intramembrane protease n=1 Tax=Clostridium sardiniense TaxID=29369 RepID=UPI003C7048E9|nr:hypothetical protein [Clostridium sardiniense]